MRRTTLAALVLSGLLVGSAAFASTYEWISDLGWSTTGGTCCSTSQNVTFTWRTNTSGAFDEYRSLYYYATTTPPGLYVPGDSAPWTEWTGCRLHSTVNGYVDEKCAVTLPQVFSSSTLWVRRTTNYAGCGTWTPAPNTATCGDSQQSSHTFTP
jgi:hypothetical protein